MDLSIVILNYKTRGLLKQCLKGLRLNHIPFSYEVIVVDNNSHDGTAAMMRSEFPDVTLIASSVNGGFAAGMNLGIRQSSGRYVLLLNPDIAVLSNAIAEMYDFLERHPRVGLAGPKLVNPDGTIQTSCRKFPTFWTILFRRSPLGKLPFAHRRLRAFLMLDWDHRDNRPVDWLLGACLMVRRTAMESVGLLDERFFLYFEDVDWCRRFWDAGYEVYYLGAASEIVHYHRRLSAESPGLKGIFSYATRLHIVSGLKYFTKYSGSSLPVRTYTYSKQQAS